MVRYITEGVSFLRDHFLLEIQINRYYHLYAIEQLYQNFESKSFFFFDPWQLKEGGSNSHEQIIQ